MQETPSISISEAEIVTQKICPFFFLPAQQNLWAVSGSGSRPSV
jgi:hypothetical protein